ncbi:hypothetical protein F4780DRAFT_790243 [Xylariomycetidae sp. FL0641]|nr:hypothetical protein F4780DRAFT_790243 [Xylariomycetidae sp. FL0641]
MKYATVAAALAPSAVSAQNWWNGAPECAQSCLSSAFSGGSSGSPSATATSSTWWPAQSEYCDGDTGSDVGGCISSACSASSSPTAYSSYSAMSSSLCSRYASCTSAGSTGVQTITYPGGPVTWAAPGGWGGDDSKGFGGGHGNGGGFGGQQQWGGGMNGSSQYWSDWASAAAASRTWTGGVATVTGCGAFDGSPWFVGPRCGWNAAGGFDGWVGWGSGWSWGPTTTVTDAVVTTTDAAGHTTTQTAALATVALAVSGDLTTSTTLAAAAATSTGDDKDSAAAPRFAPAAEGSVVTVFMGVGLGAVVAVAGMLELQFEFFDVDEDI